MFNCVLVAIKATSEAAMRLRLLTLCFLLVLLFGCLGNPKDDAPLVP
jgi:hypothetical protein